MAEISSNRFNIPEVFVKATKVDRHVTFGDISTTTVIGPPQIVYLKKHFDYVVDVTEKLPMLMGTMLHGVCELSVIDNVEYWDLRRTAAFYRRNGNIKVADWITKDLTERFPEIDTDQIFVERTMSIVVDGMEVSGTQDIFYAKTGLLQDYKSAKTFVFLYPEATMSYERQQNIYAYILRQNGYVVNKLQLVYYFTDWSKAKASNRYAQNGKKDYPDCQVKVVDLKMWSDEEILSYLKERVRLHRLTIETGKPPKCTPEERWNTGDVFAVVAKNAKKAIRKFDTKAAAQNFIEMEGFKLTQPEIEIRLGGDLKCDEYCPVRSICPQKKARDDHKSKQKEE